MILSVHVHEIHRAVLNPYPTWLRLITKLPLPVLLNDLLGLLFSRLYVKKVVTFKPMILKHLAIPWFGSIYFSDAYQYNYQKMIREEAIPHCCYMISSTCRSNKTLSATLGSAKTKNTKKKPWAQPMARSFNEHHF